VCALHSDRGFNSFNKRISYRMWLTVCRKLM